MVSIPPGWGGGGGGAVTWQRSPPGWGGTVVPGGDGHGGGGKGMLCAVYFVGKGLALILVCFGVFLGRENWLKLGTWYGRATGKHSPK